MIDDAPPESVTQQMPQFYEVAFSALTITSSTYPLPGSKPYDRHVVCRGLSCYHTVPGNLIDTKYWLIVAQRLCASKKRLKIPQTYHIPCQLLQLDLYPLVLTGPLECHRCEQYQPIRSQDSPRGITQSLAPCYQCGFEELSKKYLAYFVSFSGSG